MEFKPLVVILVAFVAAAATLSTLVIFIRRVGLRLDQWFFRSLPLTKDGFAFVSYYLNVAIIWLVGIAVLLSTNIIDWTISLGSGTFVLLGTALAAVRRKKMLDKRGFAFLKKKRDGSLQA